MRKIVESLRKSVIRLLGGVVAERRGTPHGTTVTPSDGQERLASYDDELLDRARLQWHVGDWDALVKIDREVLQNHPDRAKLALFVASAFQQLGQNEYAARYVKLARDLGCNKKLVAQILIAGVHNSLARSAVLLGDQAKAELHFRLAVSTGTPGLESEFIAQARARLESGRLTHALTNQADVPKPFSIEQPGEA